MPGTAARPAAHRRRRGPGGGRAAGGPMAERCGNVAATPELRQAVDALPPAVEDPGIDTREPAPARARLPAARLLRPVRWLCSSPSSSASRWTRSRRSRSRRSSGTRSTTVSSRRTPRRSGRRPGSASSSSRRLVVVAADDGAHRPRRRTGAVRAAGAQLRPPAAARPRLLRARTVRPDHDADDHRRRRTVDVHADRAVHRGGQRADRPRHLGRAAGRPTSTLALVALRRASRRSIVATLVFRRISSVAYTVSRERISLVNADFQENIAGLRAAQAYRREGVRRTPVRRARRQLPAQPDAVAARDLAVLPVHRVPLRSRAGRRGVRRRAAGRRRRHDGRNTGRFRAVPRAAVRARSSSCRRCSTGTSRPASDCAGSATCCALPVRSSGRRTASTCRRSPGTCAASCACDDVGFRYPGADVDALSDVDLHIPAGHDRRPGRPDRCGQVDHREIARPLLRPDVRSGATSTTWTSAGTPPRRVPRPPRRRPPGGAPVHRRRRHQHRVRPAGREPRRRSRTRPARSAR